MRKPKVPDNHCKKHLIPLSSTLDPTNMFCLVCENELESQPKKKKTKLSKTSKTSTGFKLTAAPVGKTANKYYAVLESKVPNGQPQFASLFKTMGGAQKELILRKAADSSGRWHSAKVETASPCAHWHANGMSRDSYAIWLPEEIPKSTNGNHAVYVGNKRGNSLSKKAMLPPASVPHTIPPTPAKKIAGKLAKGKLGSKSNPKPASKKKMAAIKKSNSKRILRKR
jgi:hypothetical protein